MSGDAKAWVWTIAIVALAVSVCVTGAFIYNGYKVSHHPKVIVEKRVVVTVEPPK